MGGLGLDRLLNGGVGRRGGCGATNLRHGCSGRKLGRRDLGVLEARVKVSKVLVIFEVGRRVGALRDRGGLGILGPGETDAAAGGKRARAGGANPSAATLADGAQGVVRAVDARIGKDDVACVVVYGWRGMSTIWVVRNRGSVFLRSRSGNATASNLQSP